MFALREINCCLLLLAEVPVSFSSSSKDIFKELLQQYLVETVNSLGDVCCLVLATPMLYWMKLEVKDKVSNQILILKCHCYDSFSQCFQPKFEETNESSSECIGWSVYNMKRMAQPQREIAFSLCTVEFSSTCLPLAARVTKQLGVIEQPWLEAEALLCFRVCDWLCFLRPWKFEVLSRIALGWSFVCCLAQLFAWSAVSVVCCSRFFPDSLGFAFLWWKSGFLSRHHTLPECLGLWKLFDTVIRWIETLS